MAMYQRHNSEDITPKLDLKGQAQMKTIKELPSTITNLLPCIMPKNPQPPSPAYPTFVLNKGSQLDSEYKHEMTWLLGKALTAENTEQEEVVHAHHIPGWTAYNSLLSKSMSLTCVNTPPLLAAPAHEWQTLLTILKQAQDISTKVVGPERKTVVTLDLGLYKPAKQLQMARQDCSHLILRPGELHMVMAHLRTIGSYIDSSGLDLCWIEGDLYGSATVKQILEGKHVKRGIAAHLTTLQALFTLYAEAFFNEKEDLLHECASKVQHLNQACKDGNNESIQKAHADMMHTIVSLDIVNHMSKFDEHVTNKPLARAIRQYMEMVLEMLMYIRAVRTGNWMLHLDTGSKKHG